MEARSTKFLEKDELSKLICVVVGTRPGIVKFGPVIRALEEGKHRYFIAHTGQHYSYNMDKAFFEDLGLPEAKYRVDATRQARLHGAQTAEMLRGLEEIFIKEKPGIVIVGGDANTNLAGALAARKLGITLAHMEAGLRSRDWRMPEEHNRVIIDHISEYLFAPTEEAKNNLIKDSVEGRIFVVGNTIVDATLQHREIAKKKSKLLKNIDLYGKKFFTLTIHREENVDSPKILFDILEGIKEVAATYKVPIIFPMHPRTRNRVEEFRFSDILKSIPNISVIEPLGYLDFLVLLSEAQLVFTDSGGVQEECCILKVPCVTLRDNTERPETVTVGSNVIAGTNSASIISCAEKMFGIARTWQNPFGDGQTGRKIAEILKEAVL